MGRRKRWTPNIGVDVKSNMNSEGRDGTTIEEERDRDVPQIREKGNTTSSLAQACATTDWPSERVLPFYNIDLSTAKLWCCTHLDNVGPQGRLQASLADAVATHGNAL